MAEITKINIKGVDYDIGGSGGGSSSEMLYIDVNITTNDNAEDIEFLESSVQLTEEQRNNLSSPNYSIKLNIYSYGVVTAVVYLTKSVSELIEGEVVMPQYSFKGEFPLSVLSSMSTTKGGFVLYSNLTNTALEVRVVNNSLIQTSVQVNDDDTIDLTIN